MQAHVTDVFLRDGLQDEQVVVSTDDKLEIANACIAAGIDRLEVGSFVNPRRVPQMADTAAVAEGLPARDDIQFTALALNGKGIARAATAGIREVQIVASASQAHSNANAGAGNEEILASLHTEVTNYPDLGFFAGISTAFTCPFEGTVDPAYLLRLVRSFKDMGISAVGLADTLGTTSPRRIMEVMTFLQDAEPEMTYSLHLHNAHGQALETVRLALQAGITRFDAALGGYGGCPFAPGAAGNLSTSELVRHLHELGYETGIEEDVLSEVTELARSIVARSPAVPVQSLHA